MLPRLLGVSKAKRMILMAEKMKADEALDAGMVDYIAEDYNSLNTDAGKLIGKIKANVG